MRKHSFTILLFCVFSFIGFTSFAQEDTAVKNNQSAKDSILSNYNKRLAQIDSIRAINAAKTAELENQVNTFKKTDKSQDGSEIHLAERKLKIDSLRLAASSFPVTGFFNDTLFSIYTKQGSFSPQDRASAITERIKNLSEILHFNVDSIKIIETDNTVDLLVGETILVSISQNDALWNDTTQIGLAENYRQIIAGEVLRYESETSVARLLKESGFALLVLIVIIASIFYLVKLFKWIAVKIQSRERNSIEGIKVNDYTLLDVKRQAVILLFINKIVKWIVILLLVYIALPILFGIFPWTKNFAHTLFGYVLDPLKKIAHELWYYLPNFFTILVIIIVFRYLLKAIHFFKTEIEKGNLKIPGFYPDWANPTYQLIKVGILAFMVIIIFPYLPGSSSPVFKGVSVFIGVLFTFGSSGPLSNVIAGLVLTYMRLFKLGDRVKIGEVTGDIIEKNLLVTRVRTIKNEIISIPNSTVMSSHTVNYSSDTVDKGLILHTTVTIGYDTPWKDIHKALLNAADRTKFILKDPSPFVLQTGLEDFYVAYQINAYTKEANKQATIYSELHQNIQDCCNEAGIEILSPHYRAQRDGNSTSIPTDYLSKDYKAPGFNININKDEK